VIRDCDFIEVIDPAPSSLALEPLASLQSTYLELKEGRPHWSIWQEILIAEILVRFWLTKDWDKSNQEFEGDSCASEFVDELRQYKETRDNFRLPVNPCSPSEFDSKARRHLVDRINSYHACDGVVLTVVSGEDSALLLPFDLIQENRDDYPLAVGQDSKEIPNCSWSEDLEPIRKLLAGRVVRFRCTFELINRRNQKIGGESLLLPVALAARGNIFKRNTQSILHPLDAMATGGVDKSNEITRVDDVVKKVACAKSAKAKVLLTPETIDDDIPQIPCLGKKLAEVEEELLAEIQKQAMAETTNIEIGVVPQGNWPKSGHYLKLVYEIETIPDMESSEEAVYLKKFKSSSETNHFHEIEMIGLSKLFMKDFLFEETEKSGARIPYVRKIDLSFLKPTRSHYVYLEITNKSLDQDQKNLLQLFEIDLIPLPSEGKTRLGLGFRSIDDSPIRFEDYHAFITQRRFGKISIVDQNGKKHPKDLTISKLSLGIEQYLKNSAMPSLNEMSDFDNKSLSKPMIFQYILTQDWAKLAGRDHFNHGLDVLSTQHTQIESRPKSDPVKWTCKEAEDTWHALYETGLTVWANGDNQFNCDRKPWIVMRAYYFLWVMSIAGRNKKSQEVLEILSHGCRAPRREVLRHAHRFFASRVS
jgi:hypothetical protein